MIQKSKFTGVLLLILLACFHANIVLADALTDTLGITGDKGITNKDAVKSLPGADPAKPTLTATDIIGNVIGWLLAVVSVVALAVIIYGGVMYVLSLGDEKRAEKAKHIILYAIVGLLIVGASFVILTTIKTLLTAAA